MQLPLCSRPSRWFVAGTWLLLFVASVTMQSAAQRTPKSRSSLPWMNTSLSPDERAAMVVTEMKLDEKITLLHGTGMEGLGPLNPLPPGTNGRPGYLAGI